MAALSHGPSDLADPDFLEQRRRLVIESGERMGLESVVPRRDGLSDQGEEQWDLSLYFLNAERQPPSGVTPDHIEIRLGDQRDPGIRVQGVTRGARDDDPILVVRVLRDPPSDVAETSDSLPVYTLELLDLPQVDRFFRRARFVFQHDSSPPGQSTLRPTPGVPRENPDIDYLAKDYQSFRRLILERMNAFVPNWRETHAADLGVTIVELLAHAADYLSYYQDAAMTEAYIATARQRISVRRHARLIDYRLHEGCNSRCWVQVWIEHLPADRPKTITEAEVEATSSVDGKGYLDVPAGLEVLTYSGQLPGILVHGSSEHEKAMQRGPTVFQTLEARRLCPGHNEIEIYTWGAESFSLTAGSTRAALQGHLGLQKGEVLIFERRSNLDSGDTEEGLDPRQRQVVRLCRSPKKTYDSTPGARKPAPITEIEWFAEDALAIDFPVSRRLGDQVWRCLTVARGNLLLADHGELCHEDLDPVPMQGAYRARLSRRLLTHQAPYEPESAGLEPATEALRSDPRRALPAIILHPLAPGESASGIRQWRGQGLDHRSRCHWHPRYDLLSSHRNARDFVAEIDDNGFACLRFGNNRQGHRPTPGTVFRAVYRVGLGPEGNVGAHSLRHLVVPHVLLEQACSRSVRLVEVQNHLAGAGGLGPEPMEAARKHAPEALHLPSSRQSCVIDADFIEIAQRHPEVHRAAVDHRWSGTTKVTQLFVQRSGGRSVDEHLVSRLQRFMRPHLVAGSELEILPPQHAPLHIHLRVWLVSTGNLDSRISKLLARIEAGEVELLKPNYFSFGKKVYLSEVIAETMALTEILDVEVKVFQRWGRPAQGELEAGEIDIKPFEIAQLDNDPAAPHRGILQIEMGRPS